MSVLDEIGNSRADIQSAVFDGKYEIIRLDDKTCNELYEENREYRLWLAFCPPEESEKLERTVRLFARKIARIGTSIPGISQWSPVYIVTNEYGIWHKVVIGMNPDVRTPYAAMRLIITLLSMLNGMYGISSGVVYFQFMKYGHVFKAIYSLAYKTVFNSYNAFNQDDLMFFSLILGREISDIDRDWQLAIRKMPEYRKKLNRE